MIFLRRLYYRIFKRYRRLDCTFVSYAEGEKLLSSTAHLPEPLQWRIAPEEDTNQIYGYVHLERRVRITS